MKIRILKWGLVMLCGFITAFVVGQLIRGIVSVDNYLTGVNSTAGFMTLRN